MSKKTETTTMYTFEDRLVVKLLGKSDHIFRFISLLKRIYPASSMNLSPILKNKNADGFHCFINIIMEPEKESITTKEAQET